MKQKTDAGTAGRGHPSNNDDPETEKKKGGRGIEKRTNELTSCNNPLILISMSSMILPVFVICEVGSCTGRSCSDYPPPEESSKSDQEEGEVV